MVALDFLGLHAVSRALITRSLSNIAPVGRKGSTAAYSPEGVGPFGPFGGGGMSNAAVLGGNSTATTSLGLGGARFGNPGNAKPVGRAGESPNGRLDFERIQDVSRFLIGGAGTRHLHLRVSAAAVVSAVAAAAVVPAAVAAAMTMAAAMTAAVAGMVAGTTGSCG